MAKLEIWYRKISKSKKIKRGIEYQPPRFCRNFSFISAPYSA